jgi:4-diphosphocytidyl-2-C-methyl-D-erythritol kinase
VRILAPAKLNLGLRIVGRRPDGYHELESVFVPIDLADELEIECDDLADGLEIECDDLADGPPEVALALSGADAGVPADAGNLAVRAARAFLDAAGLRVRVQIALAKRIPAAAGLGGGSSDAGAVLRALAQRFPGAVGAEDLADLALRLGADVPFFLDPRPALVYGVGERRAPLSGKLPALDVVLANSGHPVPTAQVFAAYAAAATRRGAAGRLEAELAVALSGAAEAVAGRLDAVVANDLEAAAETICPALAPVRAALRRSGALAVGLSGSGGTCYGIFASPDAAESALAGLRLAPPAWAKLARSAEAR